MLAVPCAVARWSQLPLVNEWFSVPCNPNLVCAQVCPKDYIPALLKWIDEDNLPTYLGGKSKVKETLEGERIWF